MPAEAKVSGGAKAARRDALQTHRRDSILAAARQVFAERGLEGATMRAIAEAAGVVPGTLYLQFPSREAIYAELLAASLGDLQKVMREAVQLLPQSSPQTQQVTRMQAAARLQAAALAFYRFYRDRPDDLHLGLYLAQGLRPVSLSPALDRMLNGRLIQCLTLFSEAIGQMAPLDVEARRRETVDLATGLCGTLLLEATGRLKMLGDEGEASVARHVAHLVRRLSAAADAR